MPVRLRLGSQIGAILFLLFGTAMMLVAYFNISILSRTVVAMTLTEYLRYGEDITGRAQGLLNDDPWRHPQTYPWPAQELQQLLARYENLREFEVFDSRGQVYWRFHPAYAVRGTDTLQTTDFFRRVDGWGSLCRFADDGRLYPALEVSPFEGNALVFEYYRPIRSNNRTVGGLHASFIVPEFGRRLNVVLWGNVALALIFAVTAFSAVYLWTEYAIKRPLDFILKAQEQLARGDFDARVPLEDDPTNEIAAISHSFNRMSADVNRFQAQLVEKTQRLLEVNEQYRRLNEKLEEQVDEKTVELQEFFSMITHELKVPLAAIQGYSHLMLHSRHDELSDKQRKFLQNIATATWHLLALVKNMTDSVKYEAGKIRYDFETVGLAELVAEVQSHLHPALEEGGIVLSTELNGCQQVYADRTKLQQVLINLASNAVRFSPEHGTVRIVAEDEGDLVRLTVADEGTGIAPSDVQHLFDKFSQFGTADAAAKGLGLGLYIVRRIVEGHGQTIHVESELSQGTRFWFQVRKGAAPERAETSERENLTSGGGRSPSSES